MQRRKWTGSGISPSWEEVDSRRSSESREKRLGRHTKILCKRCLPGPRRGGPHPSPGLPSAAARSPGACGAKGRDAKGFAPRSPKPRGEIPSCAPSPTTRKKGVEMGLLGNHQRIQLENRSSASRRLRLSSPQLAALALWWS